MLTPEDIFEKEFKKSMRGYDIDEVNEFLDQIIQDYGRLLEENKSIKKELQQLKSGKNRQEVHGSSLAVEKELDPLDPLQDLIRRVEALEKKTKYL